MRCSHCGSVRTHRNGCSVCGYAPAVSKTMRLPKLESQFAAILCALSGAMWGCLLSVVFHAPIAIVAGLLVGYACGYVYSCAMLQNRDMEAQNREGRWDRRER